jgi:hypothetical protein
MKKLLLKILVWIIVLPAASLALVYLILRIMDTDISRLTFILLIVLAMLIPGITLAYGFKKIFGWQGWKELILSSFLSALIWTLLAVIMNNAFKLQSGLNTIQALIILLSYFVFLLIMLQTFKILVLAKSKIKIRKK